MISEPVCRQRCEVTILHNEKGGGGARNENNSVELGKTLIAEKDEVTLRVVETGHALS